MRYSKFSEADERRICKAFKAGATSTELATEYDVTRSYIQQILARNNLTAKDGGRYVRALKRKAERPEPWERQADEWGVSVKEYLNVILPNDYNRVYTQQKSNALRRGHKWDLTKSGFYELWRTSGKFHLRGRSGDAYVLGRKDPRGDFTYSNMKVMTLSQSQSESILRTKADIRKRALEEFLATLPP